MGPRITPEPHSPRRRRRLPTAWRRLLPLAPLFVFLTIFAVYPMLGMIRLSFQTNAGDFTIAHYVEFFTIKGNWLVLTYTLELAAAVTAFCLVLGYPVAYLLATVSPRVRTVLLVAVVVPFWTSLLVRTYAWMVLLGKQGVINSLLQYGGLVQHPIGMMHSTTAVVIGMVHIMLPYMILAMLSVMVGIDRSLMRASQSLGARPFTGFLKVYLPLSMPGVTGGAVLVFIVSLGFFVTPAILGGLRDTTIARAIDIRVTQLLDWGFGAAASVVLLVLTLALYVTFHRFIGFTRVLGGEHP